MLLLVSLCAGYSICIILGVSFLVSMVMHMYAFSCQCVLFSSGKFEDNGDFTPNWATPLYCVICVILASTSITIALIQLVKTSLMLYKGTRENFATAFRMSLAAAIMAISSFIAGILVSAGFSTWCNAVEERFSKGCDAAASSLTLSNNTSNITVSEYFTDMETSQFSIWSSLVVWVILLTISGRLLFMAHERANVRIGMARERRRYNRPVDYANQPSNLPRRDIT